MASRSMNMQCWKCGHDLKNLLLPFSRYEECSFCKADLHVCMACKSFDPSISDCCREDKADFILDKDKANFCDYFKANPKAYKKLDKKEARAARAKLAELFGEEFSDEIGPTAQSESDDALAKLKEIFGEQD
jgi:hypothetical protein